ncbi:MAG: YbaK/EbsC family protein [Selenomonadaceae bacterium]|nr:YbaK/EbsC family protein [Selenomonadaceae bacterium]MBQ4494134.1 YbaK/EbsC family protein [Selenomonadaceae bacterium]
MAIEKVKKYFAEIGEPERVLEFEQSTATSELAAEALGCEVGRIAKTISVFVDKKPVLILMSGDMKLDNKKFKAQFNCRPHMIPVDEVEALIGHAVGGVCPFAVNAGIPIYFDASLKRFDVVYPAAGNDKSCARFELDELERYIKGAGWVDVAKAK